MTEYWLQKKSLSGWSMVTWYSDVEQAMTNYKKCIGNGMSGYSWRLCKVEALETSMLQEVTDIEAPELEVKKTTSWGADIQKPLKKAEDVKYSNGWGDTSSWSDIPSDNSKPEHGLTGSVWVINHALKEKKRVAASEVDNMLSLGYERGGPKTKFRE